MRIQPFLKKVNVGKDKNIFGKTKLVRTKKSQQIIEKENWLLFEFF